MKEASAARRGDGDCLSLPLYVSGEEKNLCCILVFLCCLWSLVVFQAYFRENLKSLQSWLLLNACGQSQHTGSLCAPLATAKLSCYFPNPKRTGGIASASVEKEPLL